MMWSNDAQNLTLCRFEIIPGVERAVDGDTYLVSAWNDARIHHMRKTFPNSCEALTAASDPLSTACSPSNFLLNDIGI